MSVFLLITQPEYKLPAMQEMTGKYMFIYPDQYLEEAEPTELAIIYVEEVPILKDKADIVVAIFNEITETMRRRGERGDNPIIIDVGDIEDRVKKKRSKK